MTTPQEHVEQSNDVSLIFNMTGAMRSPWIAILLVAVASIVNVQAGDRFPPSARIVKSGKGVYPHVLVPPGQMLADSLADRQGRYPLVVSLHGSSLRGNRLSSLTKYGTIAALSSGMSIPAYVLAPQCPSRQRWDPHKLYATIRRTLSEYPIDTNRIYVIGMSMGGYGTFDLVGTFPEQFAAAIAMCGGGQRSMASNLSRVPLWVIHGNADRDVPVSQSRDIVRAICSSDSNKCFYTEIPRLGHSALAESYGHQQLYDWLFLHSREPRLAQNTCPPPAYSAKDFTWRTTDKKKRFKKNKKYKKSKKGRKRRSAARTR
jgi:dienelactone hydrolase